MDEEVIEHCGTCKYDKLDVYADPCRQCSRAWGRPYERKWEPKEQKEDDMGEKNAASTYTVTFTADQIKKEVLEDVTGMAIKEDDIDEETGIELQLKAALEENERLKNDVHDAQIAVAKYVGMVDGLKHGIAAIVTMVGGNQDE